jgi:cation:H+ antiporter
VISIRVAQKGKHAIAIGNIFGSNIFNVLAVAGIPSLFGTLTVSDQAMSIGIPFFIVSTLSFIFAALNNQIRNWEGFAMLVLYAAFVLKLVEMV